MSMCDQFKPMEEFPVGAVEGYTLETALAEIERLKGEHDEEIGDFQNRVRDLVIDLSGAPDHAIDGAGSDAGWDDFTLAEISQGFAHLQDNVIQPLKSSLEKAQAACGLLKTRLEFRIWRCCSPDGAPDGKFSYCEHCEADMKALSGTAANELLEELKAVGDRCQDLEIDLANALKENIEQRTELRRYHERFGKI